MPERRCRHCQQPFVPVSPSQYYCTTACRQTAHHARQAAYNAAYYVAHRAALVVAHARTNAAYYRVHHATLNAAHAIYYRTHQAARTAYQRQYRLRKKVAARGVLTPQCPICQQPFTTTDARQRYCSPACCGRARQAKMAIYQRAYARRRKERDHVHDL